MNVTEISCKSALSHSRLLGYDYALNPYRGCEHGCSYCYAPFVLHEDREWGGFVDVKLNIPSVLSNELERREKGVVGISTVTDPYQPIEKKYELTRTCLELLLRHDFPICIQTKSALALRDLDLIKSFSKSEVGFTLTTIDDEARKRYEPGAASVEERLSTLEAFAEAGVDTWVFLGPIMPYISNKDACLENLIVALKKARIKYLMVDRLNIKRGMQPRIMNLIRTEFPQLEERYQSLSTSYFEDVKRDIARLCWKHELKVAFCY